MSSLKVGDVVVLSFDGPTGKRYVVDAIDWKTATVRVKAAFYETYKAVALEYLLNPVSRQPFHTHADVRNILDGARPCPPSLPELPSLTSIMIDLQLALKNNEQAKNTWKMMLKQLFVDELSHSGNIEKSGESLANNFMNWLLEAPLFLDATKPELHYHATGKQPSETSIIAPLVKALKEDEDYRQGWQANIAMAFQDEVENYSQKHCMGFPETIIHEISNNAADNFLKLLTMDVSK